MFAGEVNCIKFKAARLLQSQLPSNVQQQDDESDGDPAFAAELVLHERHVRVSVYVGKCGCESASTHGKKREILTIENCAADKSQRQQNLGWMLTEHCNWQLVTFLRAQLCTVRLPWKMPSSCASVLQPVDKVIKRLGDRKRDTDSHGTHNVADHLCCHDLACQRKSDTVREAGERLTL